MSIRRSFSMIILVMGVSGSGKSTIGERLANALHWTFVDADTFHSPSNIEKMSQGTPLTDEDRRPWLFEVRDHIRRWLKDGRHVVLACSALTNAHRRILISDPARIRLVYLKGTYALIEQRIAQRRHHFMPKELLRSQMNLLEEPEDAIAVDVADPPDTIVEQIRARLNI